MNIEITGRHADVNDAVKEHAHDKVTHVLGKVREDITSVHVVLDVEKTRQMAEIVVHGRGLTATVHAESDDLHSSIDRAADKLRSQLERHHAKRIDKKRRSTALAEIEAAAMAQEAMADLPAVEDEPVPEAPAGDAPAPAVRPDILRWRPDALASLSLEEATGELAGQSTGVVVFRESASQEVRVLYRNAQGRLVLVELGAA